MVLGDGYTSLLGVGRKRWVFCLSERSLLSVIVPARRDNFPTRVGTVADTLARLGVDENARARKLDGMDRHSTGRRQRCYALVVMCGQGK